MNSRTDEQAERRAEAARFVERGRSRRPFWKRPTLYVVLIVLLAAFGVWAVGFSSLLDVRQVRIHGAKTIETEAVLQAADVELGTPLARVDSEGIRQRVRELRPVREADVRRAWPHGLEIRVTERVAVGAVKLSSGYDLVDATGTPFRTVSRPSGGLAELDVDSSDRKALRAATAALAALPDEVAKRTKQVRAKSADSVTLVWSDDVTVVWGSAEQSATKAKVLAALLERKGKGVSTYDVSVPGRPTVTKK